MKISTLDDKIIIHLNKEITNLKDRENLEKYIKSIITLVKKKNIEIKSGLYVAKVYQNNNYGLIIELELMEELELFRDIIDLKILIYDNSKMYLEIEDYFLIIGYKKKKYNHKFYLDVDYLDKKDLIMLLEFGNIVYGDNISKIELYGK